MKYMSEYIPNWKDINGIFFSINNIDDKVSIKAIMNINIEMYL